MDVRRLMDGQAASGAATGLILTSTKSPSNVYTNVPVPYCIIMCEMTGNAVCEIQGRTSSDMTWLTIDTFTNENAGSRCTLFPYMRANLTTYSTGAVTVDLVC